MALQNEEYVVSLVYDYLLKKDTALASTFQEKFSAKPLPKGLPSLKEMVSYYQKIDKRRKHVKLPKKQSAKVSPSPVRPSNSIFSRSESDDKSSSSDGASHRGSSPAVRPLSKVSATTASSNLKPLSKVSTVPASSNLKPLSEVSTIPASSNPKLLLPTITLSTIPSDFKLLPEKTLQEILEMHLPPSYTTVAQPISKGTTKKTSTSAFAKQAKSISKPLKNVPPTGKYGKSESNPSRPPQPTKKAVVPSSSEECSSSDVDVASLTKPAKSISKPSMNKNVSVVTSSSEESSGESDSDEDVSLTKQEKSISKPSKNGPSFEKKTQTVSKMNTPILPLTASAQSLSSEEETSSSDSDSDEVQSVPKALMNVSYSPKIPEKKSETNQPRNVTAGQQKIAPNVESLTRKASSSDSSSSSDEDVSLVKQAKSIYKPFTNVPPPGNKFQTKSESNTSRPLQPTKKPGVPTSSDDSPSSDEDVISLTKPVKSISKPSTNGSNPPQTKKASSSDSSSESDDSKDVQSVPKAPVNVSNLPKKPEKKSEANQTRNVTAGQKKIPPKKDSSCSDDSDGARSAKRAKFSSKIDTKLSNSSKISQNVSELRPMRIRKKIPKKTSSADSTFTSESDKDASAKCSENLNLISINHSRKQDSLNLATKTQNKPRNDRKKK
ncbi:mucin-17-like [Planococcus citri]|uniref:mucin-17-like n=1 Tax=Planococcus citri TaxID=170843 RepID=UPI0031F8BA15